MHLFNANGSDCQEKIWQAGFLPPFNVQPRTNNLVRFASVILGMLRFVKLERLTFVDLVTLPFVKLVTLQFVKICS